MAKVLTALMADGLMLMETDLTWVFFDSRLDLERGVVGARRLGTERIVIGSFEREAEVVPLGPRRDEDLDDFRGRRDGEDVTTLAVALDSGVVDKTVGATTECQKNIGGIYHDSCSIAEYKCCHSSQSIPDQVKYRIAF